MDIVLYNHVSAGDMVSAVIDSTDYVFINTRFFPPVQRSLLKYFKLTYEQQDDYIKEMATMYKSCASHSVDYHILRQHDCIFVDIAEDAMIKWCMDRFQRLHGEKAVLVHGEPNFVPPSKLEERLWYSGNLGLKHFNRTIKLRDILEGNMIPKLQQYVHTELDEKLYLTWLESIIKLNPL